MSAATIAHPPQHTPPTAKERQMQVTQAQFTQVSRFPHDAANTWQHNSKPVWVTFYPAVDGVRPAHYIPYRAVQAVPAGRKPWTVDNRRIGSDRGFSALEDALNAAEVAA